MFIHNLEEDLYAIASFCCLVISTTEYLKERITLAYHQSLRTSIVKGVVAIINSLRLFAILYVHHLCPTSPKRLLLMPFSSNLDAFVIKTLC